MIIGGSFYAAWANNLSTINVNNNHGTSASIQKFVQLLKQVLSAKSCKVRAVDQWSYLEVIHL
jgi:hypothetical protein